MRISYEDTVAAYEREIQTTLRGFKPAHDFLETWVHDADPVRSLLSMAEAAQLGGVEALEVTIGPETAKGIDAKRLTTLVSQVGKASVRSEAGGLLLAVSYA